MAFVKITHPSVSGSAEVTEESFPVIWAPLGWVLAGSTPAPYLPATLIWLGPWVSTVVYRAGQAVSRSGSAFVAKVPNLNSDPPTNPNDWDVLAPGPGPGGGVASVNGLTGVVSLVGTYLGPSGTVAGASAASVVASGKVTGDAHDRWRFDAAGRGYFGAGSAAPDLALTLGGTSLGVGRFALANNSAAENVAVGVQALRNTSTGSFNTAVGRDTLVNNTTGQQNSALGYAALGSATGSFNTAVGASALVNAAGNSNTAVGVQALQNLTSGAPNTAVGSQAMQLLTTGAFNTAIGQAAMAVATTASYCVAVGQDALGALTTATDCTAIGEAAMPSNTTGYGNTAIGHGALRDNTTGAANVAIGVVTLQSSNTDGNTAVGQNALQQMTTGTHQTALGYRAGAAPGDVGANATTSGTRQTLLGALTGQSSATQRDDIVCVGYSALGGGNGAVAVGSGAQALHAGSVAIGMNSVTTAADQVMCGARDIEITDTAKGVILKSPDGTRFRLKVSNGGALSAVAA